MNWLKKFTPAFFKKLDHYLLINYPSIWSTRFHAVFFIGIAFDLLLALICFALPMNFWEESKVPFLIGITAIISCLSFLIWVVFLLRFNSFKRFGDNDTVKKPGSALLTFLLFMSVVLTFCAWCFIPPAIESFRTYRQIAADEVINDVNTLNLKIATLEFDTSYFQFSHDTTLFYKRPDSLLQPIPDHSSMSYRPYSDLDGDLSFREDSIIQVNDSVFVFLSAPRLTFFSSHGLPEVSSVKPFKDKELYYMAMKQYDKVDPDRCFKEIAALIRKYDRTWSDFDSDKKVWRRDIHILGYDYISDKYDYYSANSNINDVEDRMTRWQPSRWIIYTHILLYISCFLSLFLFMYRHTTNKTFFLSLLAGGLLFVLTALALALARVRSDLSILYVCLGYYFLFVFLALSNFWMKHRRVAMGTAINFLLVSTPFIPILLTSIYFEHLERLHPYGYRTKEIEQLFEHKDFYLGCSELAGLILLLILIEPCFKKLYTRWYALPEE